MKKVFLILAGYWVFASGLIAQTITQKLQKAFQQFESDSQLKHAISSLYVVDAATGKVVIDKNSQIGLAPASTQKVITSVTAFELLGKDYRYKTNFGFSENSSSTSLYLIPSGDPTLGSWRWESTRADKVLQRLMLSTHMQSQKFSGPVIIHARGWNNEIIPDGWIWQDIGNYYGAGAGILNWRENQFDLLLKSGKRIGDPVEIIGTDPDLYSLKFNSILNSAAKGTGDNAYIYLPAGSNSTANVRGTIPVNESKFKISGAIQNPAYEFVETVVDSMRVFFESPRYLSSITVYDSLMPELKIFHIETSPSLDSIIYWFNKKSINLYGEALIKTFAYEKQGLGSTDSGVAILRKFWEGKGISKHELNMVDGSGLSPLNRVTTHAQVEILKYAKTRDWYPWFYNSLPDYNGMKMKSGTISGVKGFCGYHKAKGGKEYIFSFLVNNYNGSTSSLVSKMYRVLDILK